MRLFIISVLVSILFGLNCNGQGFYVENDTLHLKGKWVQPVEEEAKQRKKILFLQKKLDKIKAINHEKLKTKVVLDSLIGEIDRLEIEKDSILNAIDLKLEDEKKELYYSLTLLNEEIKQYRKTIKHQKKSIKRKNVVLVSLIGAIVIETALIIAII